MPHIALVVLCLLLTGVPGIIHNPAALSAQPPHATAATTAVRAEPRGDGGSAERALIGALVQPASVREICERVSGDLGCPSATSGGASGTGQSASWLNQTTTEIDDVVATGANLGGLADDPVDGYLVRFGGVLGNEALAATWSYQSGGWRNITAGAQPSPRFLPAMAFDFADGSVLLFGGASISGSNLTAYSDTWAFHTGQWTQVVTGLAPSSRFGASMVYDPAEGGLVLFGGINATGTTEFNDTWLFKEGNWSRLDPTGGAPSPRLGFSLAWDAAAQELVGFGGAAVCVVSCSSEFVGRNDTWSFANGTWSNLSLTAAPPAQASESSQLVNDTAANELVLFEDLNASRANDCQTWSFSGGSWTPLSPGLQACGTYDPESTWDSEAGAAVYYGGSAAPEIWEPTWAFSAGNWTLADNYSYPGAILGAAVAFDAATGDAYLTGGQSSVTTFNPFTYRFDGNEWHVLNLSPSPSPREVGAFAYDPSLGGLVLFGGENATADLNDTWLLKNGAWSEIGDGSHGPSSRGFAGITFDPAIGGLLLFGGSNLAGTTYGDTWELNGTSWVQLHPTTSPSARTSFGLTYDPTRGAAVAFGGETYAAGRYTYFNDTWAFHGGSWSKIASALAPSPRDGVGFAYDPATGGDVLYGGYATTATVGDAWVLTATGWAPLDSSRTPSARAFTDVYFDTAQDTLWLYGGLESSGRSYYVYGFEYVLDALSVDGSVNVTAGSAPLSVSFSATSTGGVGPITFGWAFGDGQSSGMANTTHLYVRGGNFTAQLTATDALGVLATWNISISALGGGPPPLYVSANASPTSGYAPLTVDFTASAGGGIAPYTFAWSFGDTGIASGVNVSHTYNTVAVFNASVKVTDSIGSTASESLVINATSRPPPPPPPPPHGLPNASAWYVVLVVNPDSGNAPLNVSAVATVSATLAPVTYSWTFGDGATATGSAVHHTFATAGTYAVTVAARDTFGDHAVNATNVTVSNPVPRATSGGATVPTIDLLAVVAVAAAALVAGTAYLSRSARHRAGQRGDRRSGAARGPEPRSEAPVEIEPPVRP